MTSAILAAAALIAASPAPAQERDEFAYTYPAPARAIPSLKARFDREAARERAALTADARKDRLQAARDKRPYNPWQLSRVWSVVADTPRFLSLSLEAYSFSGGAHGNTGFDALVWDRTANRPLKPLAFFTGAAALRGAMQRPFCAELNRQRSAKREQKVDPASGGMFDECLDPVKSTLLLGSSNRRQFDRIGVLLGSYEAGPYVEGTYDVTVPVTPAILAAVRPEYRRYFAVRR